MMPASFYEFPILNSPYDPPGRHHALDDEGQPLEQPPLEGRRPSKLITPVPKPRKKGKRGQGAFTATRSQNDSEHRRGTISLTEAIERVAATVEPAES